MGDDKSRALNKLMELPAILPEAEEAWAAVLERGFQPRMQAALQRVAAGESVPDAGRAEGYTSFGEIYRHSKACGLVNVKTEHIVELHRDVASMALETLRDLLLHGKTKASAAQLAVIAGISTDKPLKYEERSKGDGTSYMGALEQVAKRLHEGGGGSLEITVTVKPAEPGAGWDGTEVVDVTPITDEDGNQDQPGAVCVTSSEAREPKPAPLELGSEPD